MKRICVVTGSRAEYGLLRWVMEEISCADGLELQVVATGMHLSPEFGMTFREIEQHGFQIDWKVEMLMSSDTEIGIAKSIGIGTMGFADALARLKPDLVVVLGDRFEILSAAIAALVARIPIAHLHGGETTEGAFDEAIRHSISKMAHLHFVAAEPYRRRIIQLGENHEHVFLVGSVGLDGIEKLPLMDRPTLEGALGMELGARNLLITFHPVTLEKDTASQQMGELLAALESLSETRLVFTLPNADTGGRQIIELIENFVASHANARSYPSLGHLRYLSCLRHFDGVVGNSSSGLIEAPAFKIGTVNIGDRQKSRLKASSVIDCKPDRTSISSALKQLDEPDFKRALENVENPYGKPGASKRIVEILRNVSLDGILKKRFFDIHC